MKFVPQELQELVQKAAPPEAGIVPLPWAFEDEDSNIAVVMPDKYLAKSNPVFWLTLCGIN